MSQTEKKEPVKITLAKLTELVKEGKSKEDIKKEFGLNAFQTGKLLKESGLRVKRRVDPAFVLIKEETQQTSITTEVTAEEKPSTKALKEKATKKTKEEVVNKKEEKEAKEFKEDNDEDLLRITKDSNEDSEDLAEESTTEEDEW